MKSFERLLRLAVFLLVASCGSRVDDPPVVALATGGSGGGGTQGGGGTLASGGKGGMSGAGGGTAGKSGGGATTGGSGGSLGGSAGSGPSVTCGPKFTCDVKTAKSKSTGLVWQRSMSSNFYGKAVVFCTSLATIPGFGSGPWRLPTSQEVQGIMEYGSTPTIDLVTFPSNPGSVYSLWTSTPGKAAGTRIVISLQDNLVDNETEVPEGMTPTGGFYTFAIRCVRGPL